MFCLKKFTVTSFAIEFKRVSDGPTYEHSELQKQRHCLKKVQLTLTSVYPGFLGSVGQGPLGAIGFED